MTGILGAAVLISTLWLTSIAYGPLPFWDAWETALLEDSWGKLWSLHNNHLIVMPRLIYGLDTVASDGNGFLSLALIFAFQALACVLIASLSNIPKLISVGLAVSFLFWARHLENLSWPFQVGFIGLCFVAVLTMWFSSRPHWTFQIAALITASIAPLWSINGLLVPLICAFISLLKKRYSYSAAHLLIFCACIALYFSLSFHFVEGDGSGDLVKTVLVYCDIVARPFLNIVDLRLGTPSLDMAASAIFALVIHACAISALIRSKFDAKHLSLLGIAAFGFGSCMMAALARSENYNGPAFRYAVFSCLALLPLLLIMAEKLNVRGVLPRYTFVLCLLFVIDNPGWEPFAAQRGEIQHRAIAAITADPDNLESYRELYPAPENIAEKIKLFRERRLSIF